MVAIFVWTFEGVMEATAFVVVMMGCAGAGLLWLSMKLMEWWGRRKKGVV